MKRIFRLAIVALLASCAENAPARPSPVVPAKPAFTNPAPIETVEQVEQKDVPLSFDRGLFRLEGTLTLPAHRKGQKVPAVVIVHGSGPMSRDGVMRGQIGLGFGFEIPVYERIAKALAAHGIAVYRYDKRTCGQFNDCVETGISSMPYDMLEVEFATGEYVRDAEAALDAVARHPDVNAKDLFFVGHSEGAQLVPVLLTERPEVRAGIMLGPPFHTMSVLIEQQAERVRWSFTLAGKTERAEAEWKLLHSAAQSIRNVETGVHLGSPILGQPPGLWRSWIELAQEAPELARKLDRPLLVLGGSYDYNVAPSEIEAWAAWLDGRSRSPHRVRVLDCVTHALNCIRQPDPTRITPDDIGRDIAPSVLDEMMGFLDATQGDSLATKPPTPLGEGKGPPPKSGAP